MPGVLASFVHVDAAADAIRALRARGLRDLVVYSAAPNHEIEEALEHRVSPVRLFTLIGGLTGCAAGFGMTLWMSYDWPRWWAASRSARSPRTSSSPSS